MTRSNARELAVHLIYAREFTGEEPEVVIASRLQKEYYALLSEENEVYADRPSGTQRSYIDTVVSGVANRTDELNTLISQFSIGWDISRISRLARAIMQLAILRFSMLMMFLPALLLTKQFVLQNCTTVKRQVLLLTVFSEALHAIVPMEKINDLNRF